MARKGWATIMHIRENRNVEFIKVPIDEQTSMVDGIPRIATTDEFLYWKNKPFIIQPSWSVKPFSPTDNYRDTIKNEYAAQGYKLLLNRLKKEVIQPTKTISMKAVIIVIIALIALGYFAYQGGYI
jgi:hypothetical protein